MGAAAVAAGVAADVEQARQRRPRRGLVAPALADDLGQADALAALAGTTASRVRPDTWRVP